MGKLRHGWRNVVPSWITHALVLVLKPRGVDFENKQFIYSSVVPRLSPKPSRMISWDDVMAGVLPCCVGEVGGFGDTGHPGCPHAGGGGVGGACPAEKHSSKGISALLQPRELCGEIDVLLERASPPSPRAGCSPPVLNESPRLNKKNHRLGGGMNLTAG